MYNSYLVIGIDKKGNQICYWESNEHSAINSIKNFKEKGWTVESYYCPIQKVYDDFSNTFKTV
jgi:hypothetical protein